jgi:hypothetical protein
MRIDPDTCRDPDLLAAEVRRLREAIRRLAEQDATLSVCGGNVTVTSDATLTDAEREAVSIMADIANDPRGVAKHHGLDLAPTLRGLLERTQRDARLAALERLAKLDQELGLSDTGQSPKPDIPRSQFGNCGTDGR